MRRTLIISFISQAGSSSSVPSSLDLNTLAWAAPSDQHTHHPHLHPHLMSAGSSRINTASFQKFPSGYVAISPPDQHRLLFANTCGPLNIVNEERMSSGPWAPVQGQMPTTWGGEESNDSHGMGSRICHEMVKGCNSQEFAIPNVVALEERHNHIPKKSASLQVAQSKKQDRHFALSSEERTSLKLQGSGEQIQLAVYSPHNEKRTVMLPAQSWQHGQTILSGQGLSLDQQGDRGLLSAGLPDSVPAADTFLVHTAGTIFVFTYRYILYVALLTVCSFFSKVKRCTNLHFFQGIRNKTLFFKLLV
jgi:hypothetical protein